MTARVYRRRVVFGLCTLGLAAGCRRPRTPEVPEVWDEDAAPERTEALGNLAPPWPAPARAQLDNGLLTFWLHEPDAPAFHVRLMVPLVAGNATTDERTAVVVETIRAGLRRQLGRRGVSMAIDHRTGRIEVAIHGRDGDAAAVFSAMAEVLGQGGEDTALVAARDRLRKRTDPADAEELAATTLVDQLVAVGGGRSDPEILAKLPASGLVKAWSTLVDPRRCVLVVHAGQPATDAGSSLSSLSARWQAKGRAQSSGSALARLRPPTPSPKGSSRHLMGDASAPVTLVEGKARGGPVLVLGRAIPTPTVSDRSLARLAQRLAQEELDVRLTVAGEEAFVLVVVPLTGRQADATAQKTVEEMTRLSAARQPRQRLFQAAQLWLGARVVQASLTGEDWTALWSESLDLASSDEEIGTALARDAETMLSVDPDELRQWQQQWFDPRGGKPGWAWVVAGADRKVERQLSRVAEVRTVKGPGASSS